jgi:cytochrome P450
VSLHRQSPPPGRRTTVADRVDALTGSRLRAGVRWTLGHALPQSVIKRAGRHGDLHGRLFAASSSGELTELLESFDRLRAAGPLYRGRYAYATVDHAVVKEVLTSNELRAGVDVGGAGGAVGRLHAWGAETAPLGPLTPPSLLVTEPPDHTRYRKLVSRVFTVRAVNELRSRTEQLADELLDSMAGDEPVDLVERYCALLPVTVIAEILGVPVQERRQVLEYGTGAAPSLDLGLGWRQFRGVEAALRDFDAWLERHIARVQREPGDDLLSRMVTTRVDGRGLDDTELKSTAGLVLAAGFETTVNLLGNGIALLHDHPEQLALLREQPERWGNAVDEVLRLDPPVLLTGRTCTQDTTVAGVPVSRGAVVTTALAGANRDPEVFEDPHRFDVTRANAAEHVSFSAGRHYCLGAALARMEGEVGLRRLFERYPGLLLEAGAQRRATRILRGFEHLPARLGGGRVPARGT